MKNDYLFRPITAAEVPLMFRLILERMKWMDEKGIRQWNVTEYDSVYPLSYYEEKRQKGEVFVLAEKATGEIVCAAVLKSEDARWADTGLTSDSAVYLHNFASKVGCSGVGAVFLQYAEKYAAREGKEYFRLDSAVDNESLTRYYTEKGYSPVGTCVDGLYAGILRQKKL